MPGSKKTINEHLKKTDQWIREQRQKEMAPDLLEGHGTEADLVETDGAVGQWDGKSKREA